MDSLMTLTEIFKYITDPSELRNIPDVTLNDHVRKLLLNCINYSLDRNSVPEKAKLLEVESVLDYLNDELNTGHWSEVPLHTKRYFTICSYVKCLVILKCDPECKEEQLKKCLRCIDKGLLLGAPLEINEDILTASAKYLRKLLNKFHQKDKIEILENKNISALKDQTEFTKLVGKIVDSIDRPTLEYFNNNYFISQKPVKLKGCLEHWPALTKWTDLNYLLEVAGERTVPVEIGSHYVDEKWTQKLMTLKEFILQHYLTKSGDIGYLAQHNLFEQIIELRDDIHIPEYCCLSLDYDNVSEPDINAWLGPNGTVSPLHQDPKNNLLAQVYGTKQIILFSPNDASYLYPHSNKLLNNTAQVDPVTPDLEKYPEYAKAVMFKCLLEPGDMLFIPEKWWHHVTALEKSFSVSFWWQ